MEEIDKICCFCNKHLAIYTCPKCNVKYCSVSCYQCKEHCNCSENFYKDEVMQRLHGMRIEDEEERSKVLEMLQRVDDQPELEPSQQKLPIDDIETSQMWSRLDDEEKKEFLDAVRNESCGAFVKPWTPWWRRTRSRHIVDEDSKKADNIPKIWKHTQFSVNKTTNNFVCDILNVVFTYAYVIQLHNGDLFDLLLECGLEILQLSSTLVGRNFKDISTPIVDVIFKINSDKRVYVSDEFTISVLEEVCELLEGDNFLRSNEFLLAALSECRTIFRRCRRSNKIDDADDKSFFLAQKKLEFFIAWICERQPDLSGVVGVLRLDICGRRKCLSDRAVLDISCSKVKREIIEEI